MRIPIRLLAATVLVACTAACGGGGGGEQATTSAAPDPARPPAQVRWESWQGIALPYSRVDGPRTVAGAATGYSHTPQGAVLAAIQHSLRLSLASDSAWPQIASQSLYPGPGKDEFVLARAQISTSGLADPKLAPTILGYRVGSYTPERTELAIYTRYPDASLAAHRQVVVWAGGDWKLLLPAPASNTKSLTVISAVPAEAVRFEATP